MTNTVTDSREMTTWYNKVQALSFTGAERARQPAFNPEMHGRLKGEALAYDVLAHIFGVVGAANYPGTTITPVTAGNFDESEVADMMQLCADDHWPEMGRSLILGTSYGANLLKQGQIIDASKRGDGGASFRSGRVGDVLGFDTHVSAGLVPNNTTAIACTIEADDDIVTAALHGFADGDRVIFPTLTGGTGLTAATVAYFVRDATTNAFKVAATPGGAAINVTVDASAGTVRKYEDVRGIAVLPSAILVGFSPVPPTDGVRKKLVDYQELSDENGLTIQYRRIAYDDTDEEVQAMEVHYSFEVGDAAQLKIIRSPLA